MDSTTCHRCSRPAVFLGSAATRTEQPFGFVPSQTCTPGMLGRPGVPFEATFHACMACGLVWSSFDPGVLRAYIVAHGNEVARQRLDDIEGGIMRGLPDTAAAREAAAGVAELDRLILSKDPNQLNRRYRELTGGTWDEAIAAARKWSGLARDDKLARLGWVAKKAPLDDLAEPLI